MAHPFSLKQAARWMRFVLVTPLAVPVFVIVLMVLLPLLAYASIAGAISHFRLIARLKREGRVLAWEAAQESCQRGSATLLVELGPKGFGDAWYLDDDLADCPLPTLGENVQNLLHVWRALSEAEVSRWCDEHLRRLLHTAKRVSVPTSVRRAWFRTALPIKARICDYERVAGCTL